MGLTANVRHAPAIERDPDLAALGQLADAVQPVDREKVGLRLVQELIDH